MMLPLLLATFQLLPHLVLAAGAFDTPCLSLKSQDLEYLPGDSVEMTCTAPSSVVKLDGFQFNNNHGMSTSITGSEKHTSYKVNITKSQDGGLYHCRYWITTSGVNTLSNRSNNIYIPVKDHLPWPVLTVDPPFRAVSEGHPLFITCTAPDSPGKRRFQFYKNGDMFSPEDVGLEGNITEMIGGSWKLHIPRAGPHIAGVFTCAYEQNVKERWLPSSRSLAVNMTVTEHSNFWAGRSNFWAGQLALCGFFFTINSLIFFIFYLYRTREGRKATKRGAQIQEEYCSVPLMPAIDQPSGTGPTPPALQDNEYKK